MDKIKKLIKLFNLNKQNLAWLILSSDKGKKLFVKTIAMEKIKQIYDTKTY